jgi:hypothetical protein
MGLKWTKPRSVKENTLLVVSASFPTEKADSDELWNIWKNYKKKLKKDGFTVGKYRDVWKISYFHVIDSNTYEKSEDGENLWEIEFKNRCKKWKEIIEKLREASIQVEEDLLDVDD